MKPFLCVTQAIVVRNAKVKDNTIAKDKCEKKKSRKRATVCVIAVKKGAVGSGEVIFCICSGSDSLNCGTEQTCLPINLTVGILQNDTQTI